MWGLGEGSLDYKGINALGLCTRYNAGFPGLSFQAPGASDENQLSQLGVTPYPVAEPDVNISCRELLESLYSLHVMTK